MQSGLKTKEIVLMAFYLALFTVLDYLANALPIFKMPNGGTLGLGTIALLLCSYQLGWKKGLIVSCLSVLMQFVTGAMYLVGFSQFLLDYMIPFAVYGIACLFPTWGYFYSGVLVTNVIRFISHALAGVFFWETPWWASCAYQASYMVPTTILGLILIPLLIKAMGPHFEIRN